MLIHDKKEFTLGLVMAIGFAAVFIYMFTPSFKGNNAFEAADNLFNSISKGSTYYVPELEKKTADWKGKSISLTMDLGKEQMAADAVTLLTAAGMAAQAAGTKVAASGDLSVLATAIIKDVDDMFYNRGDAVKQRYNIEERLAMYTWWNILKKADKDLKSQSLFKESTFLLTVQTKGVEVGYNYYKIDPWKAAENKGILTFSLVFYVIYTLWWGFSIFYLCEGVGLKMKKSAKKEV